MKFLFILNPVSGGHNKAEMEQNIRSYFSNLPDQFECFYTTGKNDVASIQYWLKQWRPDRVVAVGGDGTIKVVAEAMVGKNIPIGIIPAGSANGMARDLDITVDFKQSMHIIRHGNPRSVHIVRINDRYVCLHLSDIGLNAHLVKQFQAQNVRGRKGYAREILRVLWHRELMDVTLHHEKESLFRKAFMVVIANARKYGTGAAINPRGDLHDDLFEVVILRKLSITELLKMLVFNRPFNPEKTEVYQTSNLTIKVRRSAFFQIDGEYMGKTKKISAQIEPHALMLIFPG